MHPVHVHKDTCAFKCLHAHADLECPHTWTHARVHTHAHTRACTETQMHKYKETLFFRIQTNLKHQFFTRVSKTNILSKAPKLQMGTNKQPEQGKRV